MWKTNGNGGGGDATSIQGTTVDAAAPADGNVLIFNNATNQWEPSNLIGTTALDVNHIEGWILNEAALPFVSQVAGGVNIDSVAGAGTTKFRAPGCVSRYAVQANVLNTGTQLYYSSTGANAALLAAQSASIDAWINFTGADGGGAVFRKEYYITTDPWIDPWAGGLGLLINDDGSMNYAVTRGVGDWNSATITSAGSATRNRWSHVGLTYNHLTGVVIAYSNGVAVGTVTLAAGALDWGAAAAPMDIFGLRVTAPGTNVRGRLQNLRISNIVRPNSYFEDCWVAGNIIPAQ
jgi:hypothetical protein